ncbi:MAG: sulfatase [Myxococcota bacterium]
MAAHGRLFRPLRWVLVLAVALACGMGGLHVRNRNHLDLTAFDQGARRLLARSDEIRRRAARFDQVEALAALGPNAANGFYYRFDEALASAAVEELASDDPASEPEAERLPFLGAAQRYADPPIGTAYDTLDGQLRQLLYMVTPRAVSYRVALPAGPASLTLQTGLGVRREGPPVDFTVTASVDGAERRLLQETIARAGSWHDVRVDLTALRGRDVRLRFETRSEAPNVAFWSNPVLYGPSARRFNVLILLEDTLRADHLSAYGHTRPTSPEKDALAREGVLFERAFSQATKTRPSCPALMTSLYPSATGVWTHPEALHDRYLTLAEILRSQGFATASFIQNGQAGRVAGLHQGFDSLIFEPDERANLYRDGVRRWITRHADRNFFLYVHLVDPHSPYDPPPGYRAWHEEAGASEPVKRRPHFEPSWVEHATVANRHARYDGEIAYNDRHFGELVRWLGARGLLDDTLIVFLSDHGEHLGEHGGLWEHQPPGYRQVTHVPLLMRYPKALPQGIRVSGPVQLIDVMPTVLELAGVDAAPLLMQGDSLVSLAEGRERGLWESRVTISEEVTGKTQRNDRPWASVFFRDWHMINSKSFVPRRVEEVLSSRLDFLHLRTFDHVRDPEENRFWNGFYLDPFFKRRVDRLVRELQATNAGVRQALASGAAPVEADPAVLEQLRELGYIE